METEDWLILAGVAVVGYVVYQKFLKTGYSLDEGASSLQNAGFDVNKSTIANDDAIFARSGDTLYRFNADDLSKVNAAKKFFITLDKIVPGTWLTRAVLQ